MVSLEVFWTKSPYFYPIKYHFRVVRKEFKIQTKRRHNVLKTALDINIARIMKITKLTLVWFSVLGPSFTVQSDKVK